MMDFKCFWDECCSFCEEAHGYTLLSSGKWQLFCMLLARLNQRSPCAQIVRKPMCFSRSHPSTHLWMTRLRKAFTENINLTVGWHFLLNFLRSLHLDRKNGGNRVLCFSFLTVILSQRNFAFREDINCLCVARLSGLLGKCGVLRNAMHQEMAVKPKGRLLPVDGGKRCWHLLLFCILQNNVTS